jgi:hypothetical protein
MTPRKPHYYSERALNEREVARTSERIRARQVREALELQYDAMFGPKKIRSILRIVPLAAPRNTSWLAYALSAGSSDVRAVTHAADHERNQARH